MSSIPPMLLNEAPRRRVRNCRRMGKKWMVKKAEEGTVKVRGSSSTETRRGQSQEERSLQRHGSRKLGAKGDRTPEAQIEWKRCYEENIKSRSRIDNLQSKCKQSHNWKRGADRKMADDKTELKK